MGFTKATRKRSKARIALTGPSGSGKSYAALLIAKGLGGKIAAIDTENGSLSLYSNIVDFDVLELKPPFTPERFIEALKEAEKSGYDTIIIDSITHEWNGKGGILEIHDSMPGNSWTNWATVTPRHQKFVDAMIQSPCHVIATMRSKQDHIQTEKNGKKVIEKVGMAPQQRDGMDYEFTLCLDIQQASHVAAASKDRTSMWDGRFEKIVEAHGTEIKNWLDTGSPAKIQQVQPVEENNVAGKEEPIKEESATSNTQPAHASTSTQSPSSAASNSQNAGDTAKELNAIRTLAGKIGCKNFDEMRQVVSNLAGREIKMATDLSSLERAKVIRSLEAMIANEASRKEAA